MIGSIRFIGELPIWLVLVIATGLAVGVVWKYTRETNSLGSPYRWLLPALRALAVAMVVLTLAGPVWHRREVIGTLGRVVFAVDTSASMTVTDSSAGGSAPSRLQRAVALLRGQAESAGWLRTLSRTHEVDVVAFSDGPPSLVWSSSDRPTGRKDDTQRENADETSPARAADSRLRLLTADGKRTDLSSPLAASLSDMAGSIIGSDDASGARQVDSTQSTASPKRAAIVLLTDGRDNVPRAASDVAAQLGSASVPVHAVGIGSADEPLDVGILDVVRPDSVEAEGRLAGELLVKHFDVVGQPLRLRIESAGATVWETSVAAGADGEQSVPFEIDVESIVQQIRAESPRRVQHNNVVMDLRAVVEPVLGDTSPENNAQSFRVAANIREQQLLILGGSSRWEIRFVRNLFDRDPSWQVNTVLFGPGTDMAQLQRGQGDGQLPDTREAMARYDAIILGEIPAQQLTRDDRLRLLEFVSRGGGLIIIDGQYDRVRALAQGPLADLIPVRYPVQGAADRRGTADPRSGQFGSRLVPVQRLQPTPLGLQQPILNLANHTTDLTQFWSILPAPQTAVAVTARPDAETWVNVVGENGSNSPWLVTRLFGSGRVFYLSADQTWRWRYKVADRFHARFWNQLLSAAMQPPYSASDDFVAIGTDQVEYEPGESAQIRVRLQDVAGKPVGDATVDALLLAEDQVQDVITLRVEDPARGIYVGQTAPLRSGAYEIRVRASGFDSSALQASAPIWVSSQSAIEMSRVSLDQDSLTQITEASGGSYVHESAADQLLEQLKPLSSGMVRETEWPLWQSFYWFCAIMMVLAAEWLLRKRAGLV